MCPSSKKRLRNASVQDPVIFAVILAPLVWAPRLFISHGLYAAVVAIFVSLALLLPYCRRALHEQRDLSRRFDHHLHEEENRARVARGNHRPVLLAASAAAIRLFTQIQI